MGIINFRFYIMKKYVLLFIVLFFCNLSFGQEDEEVEIVNHTVKFGETMLLISKKYLVRPTEIYKLNDFALDGVKEGMVLQIPVPKKKPVVVKEKKEKYKEEPEEYVALKTPEKPKEKIETVPEEKNTKVDYSSTLVRKHVVEPKETLYSLARKYNVSVQDLTAANEDILKEGLQVGQSIKIPSAKVQDIEKQPNIEIADTKQVAEKPVAIEKSKEVVAIAKTNENETTRDKDITHTVEPKETLYSISRKYQISIEDLKLSNAEIIGQNLEIGQVLKIPSTKKAIQSKAVTPSTTKVDNQNVAMVANRDQSTNHVVEPKETLYGLSKKYNITIDQLFSFNEEALKDGLQVGETIVIPPTNASIKQNITKASPTPQSKGTDKITSINNATEITHVVEPKETLYSLSRKYNVTVDEIKEQNKELLVNGLQIGQSIVIKRKN